MMLHGYIHAYILEYRHTYNCQIAAIKIDLTTPINSVSQMNESWLIIFETKVNTTQHNTQRIKLQDLDDIYILYYMVSLLVKYMNE